MHSHENLLICHVTVLNHSDIKADNYGIENKNKKEQ